MICTERDQFIVDLQETCPSWVVGLNSGLVVYQDDYRPEVQPPIAWERLGMYCSQFDDYIINMQIRFRSNIKALPSNADGYYFCRGVRMSFGADGSTPLFYVGSLQNGILEVGRWRTPEMILEHTEVRDIKKAGICLISKNINHI